MLPPGQKSKKDFPRFGLPAYADRFPSDITSTSFMVEIDDKESLEIDLASINLPRVQLKTDFHCVTTWSYIGAEWHGIKFLDFYDNYIRPFETDGRQFSGAVFRAQDGYKTSLLLEDLLVKDVLLADTLDNQPLTVEHGAPLRLVMPQHYGYKNLKHLSKISFYTEMPIIKRGLSAFLDHPRARVAEEERGQWVPGWILRFLYRPLIPGTAKSFRKAMQKHRDKAP